MNFTKAIIPKRYKAGEPYYSIMYKIKILAIFSIFNIKNYFYVYTPTGIISIRSSKIPSIGKFYWIYKYHCKSFANKLVLTDNFIPNHLNTYPKYKKSITTYYIK